MTEQLNIGSVNNLENSGHIIELNRKMNGL